MSYQRAVLKVDALAAVVCDDRQIPFHPGHVEALIQHLGKLRIKALQRQDGFRACLASSHKTGAVHAKERRARHDTAFLVPINREMRYRGRSQRKVTADMHMRQL